MPSDTLSFFAALSDPTRMRLVEILAEQGVGRPLCVCALAGRLGVTQPAVSQHLRVLRTLGLVTPQRCGMRVHYVLDAQRFREWQEAVNAFLDGVAGKDLRTEAQAAGERIEDLRPG